MSPRYKAAALLVVAAAVAGCGKSTYGTNTVSKAPNVHGPAPVRPAIVMNNIQFEPAVYHARVGQRIIWKNNDPVEHNVSATKGATFHSRLLSPGRSFTFVPSKPGTIDYVCTIHAPGMAGKLIVSR